ncbi:hypothetical protein AGMMS49991_00410 [Spirochaetia bacterium]|nr:hypothetical protein AGMMS49991_00410 [Spirochaetia bacterium]
MKDTVVMQNGKKVTRFNDKFKSLRLSQELQKAISAKATQLHCSESDFIRLAIEKELLKEINDNNLIMEHFPKITREQKHNRDITDNLFDYFDFWLDYFFIYTPEIPDGDFDKIRKNGLLKKKQFLERFKEYKRANKKSFAEQLVMEFFEFGSNEGTIK